MVSSSTILSRKNQLVTNVVFRLAFMEAPFNLAMAIQRPINPWDTSKSYQDIFKGFFKSFQLDKLLGPMSPRALGPTGLPPPLDLGP